MKITITGKNFEVDDALDAYVNKKISKLGRYIPKSAKKSVHVDVTLTEKKSKSKDSFQTEIIMKLPHDELVAKDSTVNMFAAVDIVEAKIRNQLRKYKETHEGRARNRRKVIEKVRRVADREFWGRQN